MRPPSNDSISKPAAKLKPVKPAAVKAQKLKVKQDYSFLFPDNIRANLGALMIGILEQSSARCLETGGVPQRI